MPTTLRLAPPRDYVLYRDVCSYGYFVLEPNWWDPISRVLRRVLTLEPGPAPCVIWQGSRDPNAPAIGRPAARGQPLNVRFTTTLDPPTKCEAVAQLERMLNFVDDAKALKAYHALDPRWRKSGRGRLFRSPTLFEDVIKTVTSCNVAWPSTVRMNQRLCQVVGEGGAFPSPQQLASTPLALLRARCSVGYRDARIVELAKLFVSGHVDEQWLMNPTTPDDQVRDFLIDLPGIGPYAAANIMQLLGRYAHLPLDSESVRHGRNVLGFKGNERAIMRRVQRHFAPFKDHAFRSYWFELWDFYEKKKGPSWTWDRDKTASAFTASQFKKDQLADLPPAARAKKKKTRRAPAAVPRRAARSASPATSSASSPTQSRPRRKAAAARTTR